MADMFGSFHQRAPVLRDPARVAESHRLNREIMGEITGTQEHKDVRMAGTVGDALASALATIGTIEDALKALPEEDRRAANALADAEAKLREHLARADALDAIAAGMQDGEEYRRRAERNRREAAKLAERLRQLHAQLDAGAEDRQTAVRRACRSAMATAASTVATTLAGIGMLGGDGESLPLDEQLALAEQLRQSEKLRELAAICGRFTRIALHAQRTKVDYAPSEVASIHTGNDLARLLPAELGLLGEIGLEDLFYLRHAERTLAQYELVAHEPSGKGPLIVAVDESGSMASGLGRATYTRELWAKAVTLALAGVARKERRDFAYIGFSSAGECHIEIVRAKGNESPTQRLITIATHFYGGGTDYRDWMASAFALVADSTYNKADVIVLSDGEAFVTSGEIADWRGLRKHREMRCYGVLLDDTGGDGSYGESVLASLTDHTYRITDLAQDDEALMTIFAV